jgi:hypothetical protein
MKAHFLKIAMALAIASALTPTAAFSRGSAAAQDRKACEVKCNANSAPGAAPTAQTQACFKKCDTKPDSKK